MLVCSNEKSEKTYSCLSLSAFALFFLIDSRNEGLVFCWVGGGEKREERESNGGY